MEQAKELAGEQEEGVEQAEEQAGGSRAGRGTCKGPDSKKNTYFLG